MSKKVYGGLNSWLDHNRQAPLNNEPVRKDSHLPRVFIGHQFEKKAELPQIDTIPWDPRHTFFGDIP